MRNIEEILNFSHEELAEYSGEPAGTLGITMLEHLQKLYRCQSLNDKKCEKCYIKNNFCYLKQSRTMTQAVLIEMAELMHKNQANK